MRQFKTGDPVSLQDDNLTLIAGEYNGNAKPIAVDSSGNFSVSATVDTSLIATAAKQDTGNTTLSTINGKITAVNTGAVVVSSSALPSGAATESTLSTLNGKITACNTGAVVVSSSALPSGAASESTLSTLNGKVTACNTGAVTISAALPTGSNAIGSVSVSNASGASAVNIQDGGNSITIDGTITASNTAGDVAHDGVDSGNPLKIGARAVAHGSNPTAVSAADRTDLFANRHGILFSIGGHPNVVTIEAAYTGAQTDTAIVTVSSGTKIVVTAVDFVCDNANTVNVAVRVGFGPTNTPTTTGVVLTHPGVAAGSGISRGNGSGILGIGADGDDLRITCTVPTTGSCRVLVSYYTIES